jgi:Protein of unknown function (DUF1552)
MFRPISRRTLLRGAGASLALPWLESMSRAADTGPGNLTEPPLRMAFMFLPNGTRPDHWTPAGADESYEITPHLKPLEGLKNDFILLENLWNKNTVGRNGHWPKVPAWLSGGYVERTTGDDLDSGGTTIDQFAAQRIGERTPLPSLELGLEPPRSGIDVAGGGFARLYGSFLSWRDPHTPAPKEIIPQLAFDRLFRNRRTPVSTYEDPTHPSVLASLERDDVSVLDLVMEDARAVKRQSSATDQVRLEEYFESVRSVEQRVQASMRPQKRWINKGKFPLERPAPGIPNSHAEHMRLMLDVFILAFWSDSTRIGTFMLGDAQSGMDYSFLSGVKGSYHTLSHHGDVPETRDQYEKIVNWNIEQAAYFLNRLKSLDEGGTSLLDNSMVLFGATIKDGNRHTEENLPLVLAGGGKGTLRGGRRLRAPAKTPLCNLYVSMLSRMGIKVDKFGDSTGPLEGLA